MKFVRSVVSVYNGLTLYKWDNSNCERYIYSESVEQKQQQQQKIKLCLRCKWNKYCSYLTLTEGDFTKKEYPCFQTPHNSLSGLIPSALE